MTLAAAVERHAGADGDYETAVPGLWLYRSSTPSEESAVVYVPSLCVVVQGAKEVEVGGQPYRYARHNRYSCQSTCALTHVAVATKDLPCQAMRIPIDPAVVGELLAEGSVIPRLGRPVRGLGAIDLGPPLLDAASRLLALLDAPDEIPVLAPLALCEITFRLLVGPEGARLRQIAAAGAPAQRVARAIRWLRDHFAEPLRVEAIAKHVGMSPSALHLHCKNMTALSPLQYQKWLRLQEARRPMLGRGSTGAEAAFRVGLREPVPVQPRVTPPVRRPRPIWTWPRCGSKP
jgi:AraC-like DNA-binding protein